ncbi:hypothetical protein FPV67DRAFT_1481921 [Lyophyllum atratum]|nr:hypothetical protein FPV67DRAFT_1481921 [Lyophyllum atratum]
MSTDWSTFPCSGQHLPKSTSLPIFKLLPIDRPTFTCQQCGFLNTLIPLCLWCCWSSDAACREFEKSMPRARRASAPPRVFWKHTTCQTSRNGVNPVSTTSKPTTIPQAEAKYTLLDVMPTIQHTLIPRESVNQRCPPNSEFPSHHLIYRRDTPRTMTSEATAAGSLEVTTATPPGPVPVFKKPRRPRWSDESARKGGVAGIASRRPSLYFPPLRHSVSTGVDRRTPMHLLRTISTKSLRSTHIVIDFKTLHESYPLKFKPVDDLSLTSAPTQRILRRKKRVSLFRTSTPPPSRPQSTSTATSVPLTPPGSPEPNIYVDNNALLAPMPMPAHEPTHARSGSQPTNTVRLGHPSRPYYTAIRPNMSRPTSPISRSQSPSTLHPSSASRPTRPTSLPAPSRPPSPGIFSVLSSTSALSDEEDTSPIEIFAYRPRSQSTNVSINSRPLTFGPLSRHRGGFSLSGETELRMALAREGDTEGEEAFKFRDMRKKHGHGGAKVMRKVREFRRGLKGLVMGRAG